MWKTSRDTLNPQEHPHRNGRPPGSGRTWPAFAGLCLCVFIATVNTIILASALPAIAADLSATTSQVFWCSIAQLFTQCVAQPIYGVFTEIFGRKRCLITALFIFAASSLFGALAPSIFGLIAARAFQGIGTGGINVCVNVLIVDLVPRRERAKMSGIVSLAGAVGLVVGVLAGSGLAEINWRLTFYVNLPISACAILIFVFFLRLESSPTKARPQLKNMDWTGIAIFSGSIGGILFGLVNGGTEYPWTSPQILVALIVGVVGVACFLAFEHLVAGTHGFGPAFIPLRLFARRTAALGFLGTFIHAMVLWAIPYYYLLYLNISDSKSLVQASIALLPSTFIIPIMAAVTGIVMSRLGRFKYFNVLAFAFMAAGCGSLSTLRADPRQAEVLGLQVVYSLGGGMLFPGRLVAVQAAQRERPEGEGEDKGDVRMATSLVSFMTSLGQAFGIAVGSTALQGVWDTLVGEAAASGTLSAGGKTFIVPGSQTTQSAAMIARFPPGVAEQYRTIAALSIARVWYICAGLAVVGFAAALGSRNLSIHDKTPQTVDDELNTLVTRQVGLDDALNGASSMYGQSWMDDDVDSLLIREDDDDVEGYALSIDEQQSMMAVSQPVQASLPHR